MKKIIYAAAIIGVVSTAAHAQTSPNSGQYGSGSNGMQSPNAPSSNTMGGPSGAETPGATLDGDATTNSSAAGGAGNANGMESSPNGMSGGTAGASGGSGGRS
jgi:hypothetical protein